MRDKPYPPMDQIVDELFTHVDSVAGDVERWSQQESAEIYEALASHCANWASVIRSEIAR